MVRPEQLEVRPRAGGGAGAAGWRARVEQCRYYGHDALLRDPPEERRTASCCSRGCTARRRSRPAPRDVAAHGPVSAV